MTFHFDPARDILPAPAGFIFMPDAFPGGFDAASGGFMIGLEAGELVGGFRVTTLCCNRAGMCHGGKLASVCDVYLLLAALFREDLRAAFLPTVSLTLDFMAPAMHGAWVELRAETLRITRSLVFAQGLATVEGTPVARSSAIYHRTAPQDGDSQDTGAALRALLGHMPATQSKIIP